MTFPAAASDCLVKKAASAFVAQSCHRMSFSSKWEITVSWHIKRTTGRQDIISSNKPLFHAFWQLNLVKTPMQLIISHLKVVHVHLQLPAKVEQTSSPCPTLKPAPTWPSLPSSTSRCASVLTLTRSSVSVRVRTPPICPLAPFHALTAHRAAGVLWET